MRLYRVAWCDSTGAHQVDGLTLATAERAFGSLCRARVAWAHILRMPERVVAHDIETAVLTGPRNVGGERSAEDEV